jgi:hypothetical protein
VDPFHRLDFCPRHHRPCNDVETALAFLGEQDEQSVDGEDVVLEGYLSQEGLLVADVLAVLVQHAQSKQPLSQGLTEAPFQQGKVEQDYAEGSKGAADYDENAQPADYIAAKSFRMGWNQIVEQENDRPSYHDRKQHQDDVNGESG